jgi:hypothetical protein
LLLSSISAATLAISLFSNIFGRKWKCQSPRSFGRQQRRCVGYSCGRRAIGVLHGSAWNWGPHDGVVILVIINHCLEGRKKERRRQKMKKR